MHFGKVVKHASALSFLKFYFLTVNNESSLNLVFILVFQILWAAFVVCANQQSIIWSVICFPWKPLSTNCAAHLFSDFLWDSESHTVVSLSSWPLQWLVSSLWAVTVKLCGCEHVQKLLLLRDKQRKNWMKQKKSCKHNKDWIQMCLSISFKCK